MKHTAEDNCRPEPGLSAALDELEAVASEVGWSVREGVRENLTQWAELVIAWRERAGLAGVERVEEVVRELMVPAVYALPVLRGREWLHVLDLGCGSGCTGVTLALLAACGRWSLVDRSGTKITFCRYALMRCGIPGVRAYTRKEALNAALRADIVLARALPRAAETAQDTARLSARGAVVLRWTSRQPRTGRRRTIRCGEMKLWITVDPVESFT